jgi:hypothetical protein
VKVTEETMILNHQLAASPTPISLLPTTKPALKKRGILESKQDTSGSEDSKLLTPTSMPTKTS